MLRSAALSIASVAKNSCKIFCETSPTRVQQCLSSTFAQTLQSEFKKDPEEAAAAVASLSDANKAEVLRALAGCSQGPVGSVKYLNSLFNSADLNNDGKLCKDELEAALKFHQLRSKNTRSGPPTKDEVLRVFTASAIPFVGFGFLDNLIMIVAGDYIDAKLGAAFAISTMAAAGLGNLISDIAGIFMADSIESRARVFKYGRMPELSAAQRRSNTVFYVKSLGAVIGISLGCLAGMFPLLWTKTKERDDPKPLPHTQEASIAEAS